MSIHSRSRDGATLSNAWCGGIQGRFVLPVARQFMAG